MRYNGKRKSVRCQRRLIEDGYDRRSNNERINSLSLFFS